MRVLSEPLEEATSVSGRLDPGRQPRREGRGRGHLPPDGAHALQGDPRTWTPWVAQAFEGIGAQENAATGEEYTVLYARFLPSTWNGPWTS